jgi:putative methionine-R-sulfoxide reductase with GAF domain
MKLIQAISNLGIDKLEKKEYSDIIPISNWLTLLVIGGSIGCLILSYKLTTELVVISWIFLFINVSTLLFNALGLHQLGRYIIVIFPNVYLALLHLSVKPVDEKVIVPVLLIQLALMNLPWMMFKYQEKTARISTLMLNVLLILSSIYMNGLNEGEVDEKVYTVGIGFDYGLIMGLFGIALVIGILSYLHAQAVNATKELLENVQKQNQELEEGQEQLQAYIRQVEESQKAEQKRQWISAQLNKVSDVIRSNQEKQFIFDQLISTIVKALEANQGGLYMLTTDEFQQEQYLKLQACYAYGKKKFLEQRLEFGQSLVGQCYLEGEEIYMTDIPNGYTYITSGLGEATPDALFIVPLKFEEQVEGVVEVATFGTFDEYQREFLQQAGKIVGNYLYNQRIISKITEERTFS